MEHGDNSYNSHAINNNNHPGINSYNSRSSNSSHSYSTNHNQNWVDVYCRCGVKAPLRTSNTHSNPGRRFLGCVNYEDKEKACKFFIWIDPVTCPRGLDYGRTLLKKIKDSDKKMEEMEKDMEKMMKKMDKLHRVNQELKKKNEVLSKCIMVCVIGVCIAVWLGNRIPTHGRMLYLP